MIDELFNFVYSLLETEMHNSMLGYESQSSVRVDLKNIVTLRADDGTVFSFIMRNGKIRSMWMVKNVHSILI